jgi:hypothetical protein
VIKYVPGDELDQNRYPDKQWFWDIINTVIPEWCDEYT